MVKRKYCLALIVGALLLAACVPPARPGQQAASATATAASVAAYQTAVPQPTAAPAPTVAALPPASPAPSATYDPAAPAPEPQLSWELIQATAAALATAEPFPTADPLQIVAGAPASASARRGGLELELRLDSPRMVAGGSARAELVIRNTGSQPLTLTGDPFGTHLDLADEWGRTLESWPWQQVSRPGMGSYPVPLAPGDSFTSVESFTVPVERAGKPVELWARLRFNPPGGSTVIWLELEAGPIALELLPPGPEQQLYAELQIDRQGWRLQVRNQQGEVPDGPFWGQIEAFSSSGSTLGPLDAGAQGNWSEPWSHTTLASENQALAARAWVAAPGYVTTLARARLEGEGQPERWLDFPDPSGHEGFPNPALAALALGVPVYTPQALPAGARQAELQATTWRWETSTATELVQPYQLPDGSWLVLRQLISVDPGMNWVTQRDSVELRRVQLGQAEGELGTRFGRWLLSWQLGPVGFELQAPLASLTEEQLLAVAASLKP